MSRTLQIKHPRRQYTPCDETRKQKVGVHFIDDFDQQCDILPHTKPCIQPKISLDGWARRNSIRTHRSVNRWYVRGKGTVTTTGRVYETSEDLGASWMIKVEGLTLDVGNRVSYGPYVQGRQRVWHHRARGWKTIYTAADEVRPRIVTLVWTAIDRVLPG